MCRYAPMTAATNLTPSLLVIFPDTPAAATISEAELRKRQMSYAARKKLLAADPALCISKTRLSIRNLPLKVDDKDLKTLGMDSITQFKKETKSSQRTDLSADERAGPSSRLSSKPKLSVARIVWMLRPRNFVAKVMDSWNSELMLTLSLLLDTLTTIVNYFLAMHER
jgi:hypothetical protein